MGQQQASMSAQRNPLKAEDVPVIDQERNTITFKPRILNPYITCSLCMGYFRNATTITECLHTYCRSCILRYFQESKKDCPVCGHDLSPYPLEMIRHDHMTQSIINKMLANDWTPAGGDDNRKETSRATRGTRGRTILSIQQMLLSYFYRPVIGPLL